MKQPGTVVGPDDPIIYPRTGLSIIHEAELGVVIGRAAKNVPVDEADDYVLGYTCINDVSGSRFTADDTGRGTSMRWKHFDTFCPVGPWIDTDLEPGSGARSPSESSAPRSSRSTPAYPVSRQRRDRRGRLHRRYAVERSPARKLGIGGDDPLSRRHYSHGLPGRGRDKCRRYRRSRGGRRRNPPQLRSRRSRSSDRRLARSYSLTHFPRTSFIINETHSAE